jgi:hypothetical protein
MFVVPWLSYQKFVDPPGNRLIKWHLAGVMNVEPSTTLEAIWRSYAAHSLGEIAALRWSNIRLLAGIKLFETFGLQDLTIHDGLGINLAASEMSRYVQREFLWNALGLLNIGWLAGLFFLFRKRASPSIPHAGWLILVVAVNLLCWCLLEFGPSYTDTTSGSFADILLLGVGLLGFILKLPPPFVWGLLALQLFNFVVVWVWSPPYAFSSWAGTSYIVSLQLPLLIFGTLLGALLVLHLLWNGSRVAELPT